MSKIKLILGTIAGLGLSLGVVTNGVAMSEHNNQQTSTFRKIEQPIPLKIIVTLGGLGLIGLELWWFLGVRDPSKD